MIFIGRWKVNCAWCGHVASPQEFDKLRDAIAYLSEHKQDKCAGCGLTGLEAENVINLKTPKPNTETEHRDRFRSLE